MISFNKWQQLNKGDIVDIVAPSSGADLEAIQEACSYIIHIGLIPRFSQNIVVSKEELMINNHDPFCANTDEFRLTDLLTAINSNSKIIWAIKGGYGAARIIKGLEQVTIPKQPKLLIGFSDITVLHLFFQKKWNWPTIHGEVLQTLIKHDNKLTKKLLESIIFGQTTVLYDNFIALNQHAKVTQSIKAQITGGNLCLVKASIKTSWEIDCRDKIVFLEEVNERGYQVDRSLEHLMQAKLFDQAKAVIIGDFIPGYESDQSNLIEYALKRFANKLSIPVIHNKAFGHNEYNYPIPFGTKCKLLLGENITLICATGN